MSSLFAMVGFIGTPLLRANERATGTQSTSARHLRNRVVTAMTASAPPGRGLGGITSFDQLFGGFFKKGENTETVPSETIDLEGTIDSSHLQAVDNGETIILTTWIVVKEGEAEKMARSLKELQTQTQELEMPNICSSIAVNRVPDDPNFFEMTEFLNGLGGLAKHQKSAHYQTFIRDVQPLLENSLKVHICRARNGNVSEGLYPYGPGGEGGRDDMVYSGNARR